MPNEIKKIGFIGLGKMGSGMAENILKAGFEVIVYNRTKSKMEPLADKGAQIASSPKEAASRSDVIITNVMDDNSVYEVTTGENGILAGIKPGGIHIGTTTNSPSCAQKLTQLHDKAKSSYIAAPVAGRPDAAAAGQLRTWVAGNQGLIEKCTPLINAYAVTITNVGTEQSVANCVKLINNYIAIALIELACQVYTFGEKSGVDLEFLNKLLHGFIGSPGIQKYTDRIRLRNFDPAGFAMSAGLKDVELMLQASTEKRVSWNYAAVIKDKFLEAFAHGMQDKDWSAIYEVTRKRAGLQ